MISAARPRAAPTAPRREDKRVAGPGIPYGKRPDLSLYAVARSAPVARRAGVPLRGG